MRIYEQMQQYGVNNTQLELMPALPSSTAVQEYYGKHIDIFLDAWPCSGCLTTVEALWMGVPTVSYYEELFSSRQTHSILNSIGITDLSTNSIPDYVNKAVSLAVDLPRLTQLRKDLRARIAASPLQDYGGMARELAAAVEYAWSDTVSKRSKALDYIRKVA
jgi:predicted O-linked N-acetylglucosamine transferase (SPINDLY family)